MGDTSDKQKALMLWEQGQVCHLAGKLEEALVLYNRSIEICPTAEAHTFLGWAYSAQDRVDDAIAECKKAIEVDPTFGNPYNDIGSYLMKKGEMDEAIEWLERAKGAPRYEPRHFPYMNLGRIYAAQGLINSAIEEFEGALEIEPEEPRCQAVLEQLRMALN